MKNYNLWKVNKYKELSELWMMDAVYINYIDWALIKQCVVSNIEKSILHI